MAVRGGVPEDGTGRYERERVNVYCIFYIKFKNDSILRTILLMYNYAPVLVFFCSRLHARMHARTHTRTHTHTHTHEVLYVRNSLSTFCL